MNVAEIRTALAARVDAALDDDWTVTLEPEPVRDLNAPQATVNWPDVITYAVSMRLGQLTVGVDLWINESDDAGAAETLALILSTGTPQSLIDAINTNPALGDPPSPWRSVTAVSSSQIGPRQVGPSTFTAATVAINILA